MNKGLSLALGLKEQQNHIFVVLNKAVITFKVTEIKLVPDKLNHDLVNYHSNW